MTRTTRIGIAVLTAVAAIVTAGSLYRSTARDAEPPAKATDKESPDVAEVRKTADQTTLLVHYGKERTEQMILLRLEDPKDEKK